jgi:predicted DNA-binding protein (MmcQ/YjbR family)
MDAGFGFRFYSGPQSFPESFVRRLKKSFNELRALALSYPETREDHPWGESAIKVRGKTFVFMHLVEGRLSLSVKLRERLEFALQYPFASPTRYGLGKSGWVTASFSTNDEPPLDVLSAWIDESFRAVAPKKLSTSLAHVKIHQ